MKLLVCTSEYPPEYSSGVGNVAYNVVKILQKRGINCLVCSPNADLKLGSSQLISKYGRFGLYYYWHKVYKHLIKNKYDVVWLHQPLFFERSQNLNAIITVHTSIWEYNKVIKNLKYPLILRIYYELVSIIEKYCFRRVDLQGVRFTGVSSQVCQALGEIGITKEKISYIPNGVDTQHFKPSLSKKILRKKFGIAEDIIVILSMGRLTKMKQPNKLIRTFSFIEKERGDVKLIFVGKGELTDETMKFAMQMKLKNVNFLGYVNEENKSDLYACSDYYIMASIYEGQPLTLLEAMASGLPCIVSDIPSLKIVEDSNCGIMVDFSEEERAARRIIDYIKKDNLAHARNARKYVEDNLDWSIIAETYLKEFESIKS